MGLAFFQKESAHAVGLSTWDLLGKERSVRSLWLAALAPAPLFRSCLASPAVHKGLVSLVSVRKMASFCPRSSSTDYAMCLRSPDAMHTTPAPGQHTLSGPLSQDSHLGGVR